MGWSVYLYSNDIQFNTAFNQATNELAFHDSTISVEINTNLNAFIKQIFNANIKSVIHINLDNCEQCDHNELLLSIGDNNKFDHIQVILWMKTPWMNLDQDLVTQLGINDIRSTKNLNEKRIRYVISTNLVNQFNTVNIIELNASLEKKVEERTKSLTDSNKKLQSYVITNGNINTKLEQQKRELEKQKNDALERNQAIEKAFKKSSKQHIKLHKVLLDNEQQRSKLEVAIDDIKCKNTTLMAQNEEIKSQRDHIEQQSEEIESQRDIAVEQRDKILKQQAEIHDNISYARRIQQALLPPQELINQILPEHFVFNQPKDIVSGDFYWIAQNRKYSIVAVADCTGHGISGAMMSMLATGYLNEIVNKNDVTSSADILEQLRERIIASLHQQVGTGIEDSHDGLDISIGVIDILESSIEFSGANNPLYLFRDNELIELKPDKMPIGIHEFFKKPFSKQSIPLLPNDVIYLFSDGYADQFGGEQGKKLKYNRFKSLLSEIHTYPMKEQLLQIKSKFFDWKGDNEQVDDVILLGFKAF